MKQAVATLINLHIDQSHQKEAISFDISRAAVLAFRLITKSHSGAKKVATILNNDKPINPHSWKSHTESISAF